MDKTGKIMKSFKTLCCNKPWYRKGRANYRCTKCDEDVTMHLVLLRDTIDNNINKEDGLSKESD